MRSRLLLSFDNLALRSLPVDRSRSMQERSSTFVFVLTQPRPLLRPFLVAFSPASLALVGLRVNEGKEKRREEEKEEGENWVEEETLVRVCSGNEWLEGAEYAAHCYAGHQFGFFSGQLGDGAAMYIGEVVNKKGERWELQFKGAGPVWDSFYVFFI